MYLYNQYLKKPLVVLSLLGIATACEPEIERDAPNYEEARGEADFSLYVALGNSLTSGYADGALNRQGQEWSYPAIIAEKIKYINPQLEFNQPLLPEGRANGTRFIESFGSTGLPNIVAEQNGLDNTTIFTPVSGTYQNLGVPGATVGSLTMPGYGSAQGNPYFARFATTPTTTIVEMAAAQSPTFFTLWIGNNDVLGYATAGGVDATITDPGAFEVSYKAIIDQLKASNANIEGAIANIPDVNKIPYVALIRYNQLELTAEQATLANDTYASQIDPSLQEAVTYGVIENVVTERALKEQIIPGVARAVVKQNIATSSPCNTTPDPAACAETVIASGQADQQIAGLTTALNENYFLPADERDPSYNGVYPIIDAQLEANQAAIDQSIEQTLTAYEAEQLPEENQVALKAAIDSVFSAQKTQLQAAGIYPNFVEGPNAFIIEDDSPENPLGIRHLREGERILLSAQAEGQLTPQTAALPKADKYILDAAELTAINEAITAYNSIISEVANENTLALVDMNAFFEQVANNGVTENGTRFTAAFITGNAFSLDGVHLTPKGYALVAKQFINTINAYYDSQIPEPSLNNYPAVAFPNN